MFHGVEVAAESQRRVGEAESTLRPRGPDGLRGAERFQSDTISTRGVREEPDDGEPHGILHFRESKRFGYRLRVRLAARQTEDDLAREEERGIAGGATQPFVEIGEGSVGVASGEPDPASLKTRIVEIRVQPQRFVDQRGTLRRPTSGSTHQTGFEFDSGFAARGGGFLLG